MKRLVLLWSACIWQHLRVCCFVIGVQWYATTKQASLHIWVFRMNNQWWIEQWIERWYCSTGHLFHCQAISGLTKCLILICFIHKCCPVTLLNWRPFYCLAWLLRKIHLLAAVGAFFDLTKAFDAIHHCGVFKALSQVGISGFLFPHSFRIISAINSCKLQFTVHDGYSSSPTSVVS